MPALPIGARLSDSVVRVEKSRSTLTKAFDPREPRDEKGRWTRGTKLPQFEGKRLIRQVEVVEDAGGAEITVKALNGPMSGSQYPVKRHKLGQPANSEVAGKVKRLEDAAAATRTMLEEYEARRKRELGGREMTPYERTDFINRLKTFQDQLSQYKRELTQLKAQRREG